MVQWVGVKGTDTEETPGPRTIIPTAAVNVNTSCRLKGPTADAKEEQQHGPGSQPFICVNYVRSGACRYGDACYRRHHKKEGDTDDVRPEVKGKSTPEMWASAKEESERINRKRAADRQQKQREQIHLGKGGEAEICPEDSA